MLARWKEKYIGDKAFYMRGLKEYNNDKMFLIDTIKNEQDIFENVCNELLNFEI